LGDKLHSLKMLARHSAWAYRWFASESRHDSLSHPPSFGSLGKAAWGIKNTPLLIGNKTKTQDQCTVEQVKNSSRRPKQANFWASGDLELVCNAGHFREKDFHQPTKYPDRIVGGTFVNAGLTIVYALV
jgi:hypothetical protein